MLVNRAAFDEDVKPERNNKTSFLLALKWRPKRKRKTVIKQGEEVIDIPCSTQRALPKRELRKTEKMVGGGGCGNVLLNVSNDHKHINHRARGPLLGK